MEEKDEPHIKLLAKVIYERAQWVHNVQKFDELTAIHKLLSQYLCQDVSFVIIEQAEEIPADVWYQVIFQRWFCLWTTGEMIAVLKELSTVCSETLHFANDIPLYEAWQKEEAKTIFHYTASWQLSCCRPKCLTCFPSSLLRWAHQTILPRYYKTCYCGRPLMIREAVPFLVPESTRHRLTHLLIP